MTIDLFAASFICRDAELGQVLQIGRRAASSEAAAPTPPTWSEHLAGLAAVLAGLLRRGWSTRPA